MSWRFNPASFQAAIDAARAGADPEEARDDIAALVSSTIGAAPYIAGYRSNASVPVPPGTWELAWRVGIGSGALTVDSHGIYIAQADLESLEDSNGLDMISPTRVIRIESSTDPNVYAEGWLGQSLGDDAIISGQLPAGAGIALVHGGLRIDWDPALDGVVAPDPGGGTSGTISDGDSRLDWEIDPRKTFDTQSYPVLIQSIAFPNVPWYDVPDAGIQFTPSGGGAAVVSVNSRVTDPDDGSKYAVVHRIQSDMPQWQGDLYLNQLTYRAEAIATEQATDPGSIYYGRPYWYAFSFRLGSDFTTGNGSNSIMDFHAQGMADVNGNSTRGPSPISYIVQPNGGTITLQIWRTWSTGTGYRYEATNVTVPVTTWVHLIARCRLSWDTSSVSTYHEVWMATGSGGALTPIISWTGVPIGFNDGSAYIFGKTGLYRFSSWAGETSLSRTMHTKGIQLWNDVPTSTNPLNAANLLAYRRTL